MQFSENLRVCRKEKSVSAKTLSSYLNCSQSLIYEWEKGRSEPSLQSIIGICTYFQVSADFLLGITDEYDFIPNNNSEQQRRLSKTEEDLIKLFFSLNPFEQQTLWIQIRALAKESSKTTIK